MIEYDWKNEIELWTEKKRTIKPFQKELIDFFQLAFENTYFPDKSLFGTNNYSISLLTGGIFFAAYTKEGVIWVLLDRQFTDIPNSRTTIVKSTKTFSEPLFWLETDDLKNIKLLTSRPDIWHSFKVATNRIFDSKMVTAPREHIAKNKVLLSEFFGNKQQNIFLKTANQVETELQEKINSVRKLSKKKRQEILENSEPKPTKTTVKQAVFNRNPYVIVEVLERANGICERCKKPGPFLRDLDNSPYLEVHHIQPLAEGGDDTVKNAIGLCPNCHKQAHYGKKTY
jgi:hypothetical protein